MDIGENIRTAFKVVSETHKNIDKMMNYCRKICDEDGEYALVTPKFLRWKSDNDYTGWMINDFIMLFKKKSDKKMIMAGEIAIFMLWRLILIMMIHLKCIYQSLNMKMWMYLKIKYHHQITGDFICM